MFKDEYLTELLTRGADQSPFVKPVVGNDLDVDLLTSFITGVRVVRHLTKNQT